MAIDLASDLLHLIDHEEVPGQALELRVKVTDEVVNNLIAWATSPLRVEGRLVITGLNLVQASDIGDYVELEVELE